MSDDPWSPFTDSSTESVTRTEEQMANIAEPVINADATDSVPESVTGTDDHMATTDNASGPSTDSEGATEAPKPTVMGDDAVHSVTNGVQKMALTCNGKAPIDLNANGGRSVPGVKYGKKEANEAGKIPSQSRIVAHLSFSTILTKTRIRWKEGQTLD
ncbi:hypothetical protein EJ06DRAFT_303222 [Trichodelitschia bisporula]|uniref:Uncharacterized protein n=1 Tax=Trichodelitschia bisporula TaxID=703511 RepID=A0A6G1I6T8_9PEZI|nr:hypothetical protein EJ06DRAFT_303222 [Trichodelitschia bisporula]